MNVFGAHCWTVSLEGLSQAHHRITQLLRLPGGQKKLPRPLGTTLVKLQIEINELRTVLGVANQPTTGGSSTHIEWLTDTSQI